MRILRFPRSFRLLAAVLLALSAASCVLPESERVPEIFQMNPSATTLTAFQTSVSVTVQCDLSWKASLQDASWGSIEVKSENPGTGGSFLITFQPNLGEEERENTLILKAGKAELKQSIRQGGLGTFFSPRKIQLQGTQEATVTFDSPFAWKAEVAGGADWLTLTRDNGSGGPSRIVCAANDANMNVGSREAVIRVKIGESQVDIPVVQGQKDVILSEEGNEVSLDYDAESLTVHTQYNVEYKIETNASWITHTSSKAPLHTAAEVFSLEQNTGTEAREAQIRFTDKAHPETMLVVKVTQGGRDAILAVTEPGFYGIQGVNYIKGEAGFNQSSVLVSADQALRFRLMNAASLTAVTLSGLKGNAVRGDQLIAEIRVQQKDQLLYSQYLSCSVIELKNDTWWLKAGDETFFVLKK